MIKYSFFNFCVLLTVALITTLSPDRPARAELEIDITRGVVEPMRIAVPEFHADLPEASPMAGRMSHVIRDNLQRSGLFKPLSPQSYIQSPQSLAQDGPRFPEWRAINAEALVSGRLEQVSDGRTRVEFRLWDVYGQRQMSGMAYMTSPANWRRIAHIISDEIYRRMTGEKGYFDTRIVYVSEQGPPNDRIKRLAIMDQDGFNHQYLTNGNYLVLTPRFSPNSQKITYLSYFRNKPRVYIYDLNTGRQRILGDFPGMTFAPRFSPDGQSVIMSLARDGNSDIFRMNIDTKEKTRLTNQPSIETSPSYAPDGSRIVFESDRGGSQQLYVMDSDGRNQRRITFEEGRYANPVWSPRGDLIAFTKMKGGKFYIGVIRPDGSGERLLTSAFHVEGPSWSPNGRVLIYFKERPTGPRGHGRSSKLYTIDLTGYNEQLVPTPQYASDPAWSPLNH